MASKKSNFIVSEAEESDVRKSVSILLSIQRLSQPMRHSELRRPLSQTDAI